MVVAGAGTGKTRTLTRRFAWLVEQGIPAGGAPRAHLLQRRRGRDARAPGVPDRAALRGAARGHLPLLLLAPAARRGARGRARPVLRAGHPRRPARAAARPHRRPDAAPPRDPRQPGAAAGQLRVAHRPAEGRDGVRRRAARATRSGARPTAEDDAARAHADARARVRPPLRRPRPAAGRARRARLRRPDRCGRSAFCTSTRTCASASPTASATCSSTSTRTRTSPRACCCACWPRSTANITVVGDDDQAIYRFRGASQKNLRDFQREFPEATETGWSATTAPAGASSTPPARWWRRSRAIGKKLKGASGGRVRFWRCRSERAQAQAVAAEAERLIAGGVPPERDLRAGALGQGRGRRRGARRSRSARCPSAPAARPPTSSAPRCATCSPGCGAGRPDRLGRRRARALAAADRAALGRRRPPHPARPPAQARHAERGGRGARGAAALRGGPRPGPRFPAPLPLGLATPSRTAAPTRS